MPASARKAALINAYNALTVRWILSNYPVRSIWSTEDPFRAQRHVLDGKPVSLDEIENRLRAMGDPRDDEDSRRVHRQALAGMIWNKQFYYFDVRQWIQGDPGQPPPPPGRKQGRNKEWKHLNNADVLSMPDKWEYPWYAAWDLAFQALPLSLVDPDFAKEQLVLLTREWYMHPNGQLPAYEWAFGDVNPPCTPGRLGGSLRSTAGGGAPKCRTIPATWRSWSAYSIN
jgi:hypothetical protein